jgi:hypothetical protein
MKYGDAILKGFATSVAIVVATVLSIFIWNAPVDGWFVVGAAMVITAAVLYSKFPPEDKYNSGPSQKSLRGRRHRIWWLRIGLLLAVLFMLSRNILIRLPTNYIKNMELMELPMVENLPSAQLSSIPSYSAFSTRPSTSPSASPSAQPRSSPLQECMLRDISNQKSLGRMNTQKHWPHCLRFQCMRDASKCDNTLATNFDGPDPPCCVHILRDMARQFDRVMCYLGLEYLPALGMLLGLARSDRLIPWTMDNDFIVSTATMNAMISLWHTTSHLEHGMSLVYDQIDRMCVSPSFANGRLIRWKVNGYKSNYIDNYPYTDFYLGDHEGEEKKLFVFTDMDCVHPASTVRPYVRRSFYNGTLWQYFPNKPDNMLTQVYGPNWRVPDPRKNQHGNAVCKGPISRVMYHKKKEKKKIQQNNNNVIVSQMTRVRKRPAYGIPR